MKLYFRENGDIETDDIELDLHRTIKLDSIETSNIVVIDLTEEQSETIMKFNGKGLKILLRRVR